MDEKKNGTGGSKEIMKEINKKTEEDAREVRINRVKNKRKIYINTKEVKITCDSKPKLDRAYQEGDETNMKTRRERRKRGRKRDKKN